MVGEDKTPEWRTEWAVCPRIEADGLTRKPELFPTESEANRFLKSVRFVDEEESVDPHLEPIRNEHQGWQKPVPVRRVSDCRGPKCNLTVRDFVVVENVAPVPPAWKPYEIAWRALQGRSDYAWACYLDADWQLDEIEADAWQRAGHNYEGTRAESLAEIVVAAIYDLEAALWKLYPAAPCAAAAAFWRSWQVQRHIAEFCYRLADSDTGQRLGRHINEAERVRRFVCRRLAVFAHELADDATSSSAPDAESAVRSESVARPEGVRAAETRRGYRAEIKTFMKARGLRTNQEAARRLGVSVDTLKSMMSSKGAPRFAGDTLKAVLDKIGFKGQ